MKQVYLLQPYHVGSKKAKSIAVVIPAEVVKVYEINTSTILTLRTDVKAKRITLQTIKEGQEEMIPAEQGRQTSIMQVSHGIQ